MQSISQEDHGTHPIPPTGCSNRRFFKSYKPARAIHGRLICSRTNSQLHLYCSWKPDPEALVVDALLISWKDHYPYMFPPFYSHSSLSTQDRGGACNSTFSCSSVVEPNLVSNASQISDQFSNSASSNSRHWQGLSHPLAIKDHLRLAVCMACLGQSYVWLRAFRRNY